VDAGNLIAGRLSVVARHSVALRLAPLWSVQPRHVFGRGHQHSRRRRSPHPSSTPRNPLVPCRGIQSFRASGPHRGFIIFSRERKYGLEFYLQSPAEQYEDGTFRPQRMFLVAGKVRMAQVAQLVRDAGVSFFNQHARAELVCTGEIGKVSRFESSTFQREASQRERQV